MRQFDHEKLNVYHSAIRFVAWSSDLLADLPKNLAVHGQLDRSGPPGSHATSEPPRCRAVRLCGPWRIVLGRRIG